MKKNKQFTDGLELQNWLRTRPDYIRVLYVDFINNNIDYIEISEDDNSEID